MHQGMQTHASESLKDYNYLGKCRSLNFKYLQTPNVSVFSNFKAEETKV